MTRLTQTPSQTVGPFFSIGLSREPQHVLVAGTVNGERISVEGRLLDGAGAPIEDAVIEIWQADANGRYRHPADPSADACDPGFVGFGRAATDLRGLFLFETIKPGPVRAGSGEWQAPHLNVIVFARGMLLHAFTRMYFTDDSRTGQDPLLATIDPARRQTLIASRLEREGRIVYQWEVHLQGERETVFFDA
jgi:protocatechuate 3,4-dioxygenase alpha subunit